MSDQEINLELEANQTEEVQNEPEDAPVEEKKTEDSEPVEAQDGGQESVVGQTATVNSEAVCSLLGLESPEVEIVSQGEVESVVRQGDKEFVLGNESLTI